MSGSEQLSSYLLFRATTVVHTTPEANGVRRERRFHRCFLTGLSGLEVPVLESLAGFPINMLIGTGTL